MVFQRTEASLLGGRWGPHPCLRFLSWDRTSSTFIGCQAPTKGHFGQFFFSDEGMDFFSSSKLGCLMVGWIEMLAGISLA